MTKLYINNINDTTYRLTENGTFVYMYLLIGSEKAMLIDTSYGLTDMPQAIREITNLPLLVVNTHGHIDHTHGNHLFESIFLSHLDNEVFERHNDVQSISVLLKKILPIPFRWLLWPALKKRIKYSPPVHQPLPLEGYFELGGRRVRIIETPGHTMGSISLLDEKNGWLFAGDTSCSGGVLLQFPESSDVETFRETIRKLRGLGVAGEFNTLFPGHPKSPVGLELLETYEQACDRILAGDIPAKDKKRGRFVYNKVAITFDPQKINAISAVPTRDSSSGLLE